MGLFNRKKDNSDVLPAEVREYYKSEQRSRSGKAWILAIVTLLVTFLIAAALFFGGRWVYRTVFSNNDETPATSQETVEENGSASEESVEQQGDTPAPQTTGSTSSTNTSATPPAPNPSTPSVPSTGPSELVNTGPGDEY